MRIDLDRVAASAIETTLNGARPKRRGRPVVRALAAGAALLGAVRVGQKGLPSGPTKLMKLGVRTIGDLREVKDALRDKLADGDDEYEEPYDGDDEDEDPYDGDADDDEDDGGAEPEEDGPRGGQDEELEPEDEQQEDWEDEADEDQVEDEDDADEDQADEDDADEDQADEEHVKERATRGVQTGVDGDRSHAEQAPEPLLVQGASRRRPPVMSNGSDGPDPASQPPARAKTKSKTGTR